jgi:type IV secretion system protein TrbJ
MMKTLMVVAALGCVLLAMPRKAEAQLGIGGNVTYCTNCTNEATSLAANATQAIQLLREATTALQTIQMAQLMVTEAVRLAQHPSTNIVADLSNLSAILVQSQGLAGNMAKMSTMFTSTYSPYSPNPVINYAQQYNNWANTTLKTLNGSLMSAGYQGQMLQNESTWMAQIQLMNQTSMGRDQSLQLGNTIAQQEVSQMQALRQLMMADMQSKAAFMAGQVNQQQGTQLSAQSGFGYATPVSDGKAW